jgi:putative transposase
MARLLRVSTSGYYAWLAREPSKRSCSDAQLLERIRTLHASSRGTYGAPRIHAQLAREGVHVGRKRVARLMRMAGLHGASRRRWPHTTRQRAGARRAPDLVRRHFCAEATNMLWVADATYIPTGEGFLYLAVVLDVFSHALSRSVNFFLFNIYLSLRRTSRARPWTTALPTARGCGQLPSLPTGSPRASPSA